MSEIESKPARTEIEGSDEVVLRQLALDDAQAYFDLIDYDRAHMSQHDDETAKKYQTVDDVIESIENSKPTRLRFGVWEGDKMVGSINLDRTEMDYHGKDGIEVGYWVGAEHIGHGYAAKALKAILPFAFEQLGTSRIYAQVDPQNTPSRKTLERCGFTLAPQSEDDDWLDYELFKVA